MSLTLKAIAGVNEVAGFAKAFGYHVTLDQATIDKYTNVIKKLKEGDDDTA